MELKILFVDRNLEFYQIIVMKCELKNADKE